jgi:uncharacterized damage-inducible protein DinB
MSQRDVATLVSEIDRARRRLYALLRSKDRRVLAKRPASGDWSIIENVRHLLFAEQLHLGKFLPAGFEWSCVGLSGKTGRAYAQVGTEPSDDLEEVLQAWNAVHSPIRAAVQKGAVKKGDEEVQQRLDGNLNHLMRHFDIIEKLLSELSA